jgi:hypothetical protein
MYAERLKRQRPNTEPQDGPRIVTKEEDICVGLVILQKLTLEEFSRQMEESTFPLE